MVLSPFVNYPNPPFLHLQQNGIAPPTFVFVLRLIAFGKTNIYISFVVDHRFISCTWTWANINRNPIFETNISITPRLWELGSSLRNDDKKKIKNPTNISLKLDQRFHSRSTADPEMILFSSFSFPWWLNINYSD